MWAYVHTRLLTWRIAALVLLITGLAVIASTGITVAQMVSGLGLVTLLVVQFRIWDDLEDLPYDRAHHPQRVLVTAVHPHRWWWPVLASWPLTAMAIIQRDGLLPGDMPHVALYAAVLVMLTLTYRLTADHGRGRIVRQHLVLLKYPAVVIITSSAASPPMLALSGASAYLAVHLHDALGDPLLRRQRWLIAGESLLLILLCGGLLWPHL